MYCKYCGQKIDDDSTYCAGCGAKLSLAIGEVATEENAHTDILHKRSKLKPVKPVDDEEFEPTFTNIMAQFSPFGRVVFIALCILMVIWVATLTVHIFYPEFVDLLSSL